MASMQANPWLPELEVTKKSPFAIFFSRSSPGLYIYENKKNKIRNERLSSSSPPSVSFWTICCEPLATWSCLSAVPEGCELLSWGQSTKEVKVKRLLPFPSSRREGKEQWMTLLEKPQPWDVLNSWIGGNTIWRNQEFLSPGSHCYGRNSIANCENFQFTLLKYQRSLCFDYACRNPWVSIPNKLTQLFWCHCISIVHSLNN